MDIERDPGEVFKDANGPEHTAPENAKFSASFDEFAGLYARDPGGLMAGRHKEDYAFAADAYALGQRLARDQRYVGADWTSAQADARSEWDKTGRGGWDRAAPHAQNGWEEIRGMG